MSQSQNQELNQILADVHTIKLRLLEKVNASVLDNEQLLNASKWYYKNSQNSVSLDKNKATLCFKNTEKKTNYISYLEKNNSFTVFPSQKIPFYSKDKFKIYLKIKAIEGNLSLVIIEYSDKEKIQTTFLEANKEQIFKVLPETKQVRIAFRISGNSEVEIEQFTIERVHNLLSLNATEQNKKYIKDLKIACILDEFSMTCFGEEAQLIPFTPQTWKQVLSQNHPDLLLVESAWHGNNRTWEYKIGKYHGEDRSEIKELIQWCKEKEVPTVFWNKEDPFHFDKFIETAKLFDYIFTTDVSMVPKYEKVTKKKNVSHLSFAAQPSIHNPTKIMKNREEKICFAGTYYANRHEERKKDLNVLLSLAKEYGLDIYDRNYYRQEPEFKYPKEFRENIVGTLHYSEILNAYKGYKFLLNVNSVKHSESMFSRRVFEGLACGTPIISNYSKGIKTLFKRIVTAGETTEELKPILTKLFYDEYEYRKNSIQGIREVYQNHLYEHRMRKILSCLNIDVLDQEKSVTMCGFANSELEVVKLIELYQKQSYSQKQLVIFISHFKGFEHTLNQYNQENCQIILWSYMNQYYKLTDIFSSDYISIVSLNHYYGENYLLDLMIAEKYSKADIIGKENYYEREKDTDVIMEKQREAEYLYTNNLNVYASIFSTKLKTNGSIQSFIDRLVASPSLHSLFEQGMTMYSSDKYNFVKNGRDLTSDAVKRITI
ncbi:TPA: glycosyltransferase [Enterococcus hirae]|uniref:CgeB family protein n=1 Tax=Enterococcus hirae TaxID=1354 RepID=UPI000DE9C308|nr:glycosyltransferase [Enterococcus hirae]RBT48071.1 hypothetical protein EA74_02329 [Enterococcus hirae]RBT66212.1 hypothetical protein EA82_02725 [Enterococcus hirae]